MEKNKEENKGKGQVRTSQNWQWRIPNKANKPAYDRRGSRKKCSTENDNEMKMKRKDYAVE